MEIKIIRKMDYWLGIPICFLLTIIYKLQKIFINKIFIDIEPKRIMFLELSEMGSAILAYPAMEKVLKTYPGAKLYFWIFKRNQDSVHILDLIPKDNVIIMRDRNIFVLLMDTIRNIITIRKQKIDVIFDLGLFSRFTAILSYLSGAKYRTGYYRFSLEGLYKGNLYTHNVKYNPYLHISLNFLFLVESLKFPVRQIPLPKKVLDGSKIFLPKIKTDKKGEKNIFNKLTSISSEFSKKNKIVVVNPGTSKLLPLRQWPIDKYIKLIRLLLNNSYIFVVLIGDEYDFSTIEDMIFKINSKKCINLSGRTNLNDLVDLFNIANLFITHDSGPAHVAALSKVNMIVLFGPETPKLYAPLTENVRILYKKFSCSPCVSAYNYRNSMCDDNKCMQAIKVKEVYDIAMEYLC